MRDLARIPSARGVSVKDDWRAWLPEEKNEIFHAFVRQLELSYNMWSVALDEALELRSSGRALKASQAVGVAPDLCSRLSRSLVALLWAVGEHARHYGTLPNAAPLDPANFQGSRCQRSARLSSLFCRVLLSERSHFLYKVSTLGEMVEELDGSFRAAASSILELGSLGSEEPWRAVDGVHYDLNTCLRETIVVLKSFMMALPYEELATFHASVNSQMRVSRPRKLSLAQRLIRHGRIASIAGE